MSSTQDLDSIIAAIDAERRKMPRPPGVYLDEHAPLTRIKRTPEGDKVVKLLCAGLPGEKLGEPYRYLVHPERFDLFRSTVEKCGFLLQETGKPLPAPRWILVPRSRW